MRRFWIVLIIVGLMVVMISPMAFAQQRLKVATIVPDGTTYVKLMRQASKTITEKTDGRVTVQIFPGGVMGTDQDIVRRMMRNQLQGSTFTAGGISRVSPGYQILSLPMLFRSYEEVDAAKKVIEPIITQRLADKGYISMGIIESGFVYMMSNKPLKGVDDLKGQKVWIPEGDPVSRVVFETAGVPPKPLALTDVMTGLNTGLVNTVSSSPVGTIALQWFTKVQYLTDTPLLYSYGTFAFSKKSWMKLSEADRAIIKEELQKLIKTFNKSVRVDNEKALATLKSQLTFVSIKGEDLPRMQKIADDSIQKLINQGDFDADMVAKIRAAVNAVREAK